MAQRVPWTSVSFIPEEERPVHGLFHREVHQEPSCDSLRWLLAASLS